jgi:hypothetical protein
LLKSPRTGATCGLPIMFHCVRSIRCLIHRVVSVRCLAVLTVTSACGGGRDSSTCRYAASAWRPDVSARRKGWRDSCSNNQRSGSERQLARTPGRMIGDCVAAGANDISLAFDSDNCITAEVHASPGWLRGPSTPTTGNAVAVPASM